MHLAFYKKRPDANAVVAYTFTLCDGYRVYEMDIEACPLYGRDGGF